MKLLCLLRLVLREIFDETAYERFCAQQQVERGKESYSSFLRMNTSTKIRCC